MGNCSSGNEVQSTSNKTAVDNVDVVKDGDTGDGLVGEPDKERENNDVVVKDTSQDLENSEEDGYIYR